MANDFPSLWGLQPTQGLRITPHRVNIPNLSPLQQSLARQKSQPKKSSNKDSDPMEPISDEWRIGAAQQWQELYNKEQGIQNNLINTWGVDVAMQMPEYKASQNRVRDLTSTETVSELNRETGYVNDYKKYVESNNAGSQINLDQWLYNGGAIATNQDWVNLQEYGYTGNLAQGSRENRFDRGFKWTPSTYNMKDARVEADALFNPASEKMNSTEWADIMGDYIVGSSMGILKQRGGSGDNYEQLAQAREQAKERLGIQGVSPESIDLSDPLTGGYLQGFMQRLRREDDGWYFVDPTDLSKKTRVLDDNDDLTENFFNEFQQFVVDDLNSHDTKRREMTESYDKSFTQFNADSYARAGITEELEAFALAGLSATDVVSDTYETGGYSYDSLFEGAVMAGLFTTTTDQWNKMTKEEKDKMKEAYRGDFDMLVEKGVFNRNLSADGNVEYFQVPNMERTMDGGYAYITDDGMAINVDNPFQATVYNIDRIMQEDETLTEDDKNTLSRLRDQQVGQYMNQIPTVSYTTQTGTQMIQFTPTALDNVLGDWFKAVDDAPLDKKPSLAQYLTQTDIIIGATRIEGDKLPGTLINMGDGALSLRQAPMATNFGQVPSNPSTIEYFKGKGIQVQEKDGYLVDANGQPVYNYLSGGNPSQQQIVLPSYQTKDGTYGIMTDEYYNWARAMSDQEMQAGNLEGVYMAPNHYYKVGKMAWTAEDIEKMRADGTTIDVPAPFNTGEEEAKKYMDEARSILPGETTAAFSGAYGSGTVLSGSNKNDVIISLRENNFSEEEINEIVDYAETSEGTLNDSDLKYATASAIYRRRNPTKKNSKTLMIPRPIVDKKGNINSYFSRSTLLKPASKEMQEAGYKYEWNGNINAQGKYNSALGTSATRSKGMNAYYTHNQRLYGDRPTESRNDFDNLDTRYGVRQSEERKNQASQLNLR